MSDPAFEQVVAGTLSEDNLVRSAAEKRLSELRSSDPDTLLRSLIASTRASSNPSVRLWSLVALKNFLVKDDSSWPRLSPDTRVLIKSELISAIQVEKDARVLRKLSDAVSDVAAFLSESDRGGWPELLPFTFHLTTSSDPLHRESALELFSQLAIVLGPEVFRPHFPVVRVLLQAGLADAGSVRVRLAALSATVSFLQIMEQRDDEQHLNQFGSLIPGMFECVTAALQQGHESEAQDTLELYAELAESKPGFFKSSLQVLCSTMFSIAQAAQLSDDTRRLAMEVLTTLCESRPGMMRKLPEFVHTLIAVLLQWLVTVEDYQSWYEFADSDEATNSDVAEDTLDRVCLALHGKTIVPELFGSLNALVGSEDWRHRYAALMCVSICGEGCQKALKPHLTEVLKVISPMTADANPRVRWAATNTFGQLCTDFGPELQMKHGDVIIAAMTTAFGDSVPRVRAHGATVLINFVESADSETIPKHAPAMLAGLESLLQNPGPAGTAVKIQEFALTSLAAVADRLEKDFIPYYDRFAPYLKTVIQKATDKQYRLLRGKAMECLSLMGVGVGREKFAHDAAEVMQLMMNTQVVEADDPQIGYLETAFGRLAECLGADFVPFLPVVMPSAIARASMSADVNVLTPEQQKQHLEHPVEGWEVVPMEDNKSVAIHTSLLEEKCSALQIILCYAANLKGGFATYIEQVARAVLPVLSFFYHEGCRQAAYSILPYLFESAKLANPPPEPGSLASLWNYLYDGLMKALPEECDVETRSAGLQALERSLAAVGDQQCPLDAERLVQAADAFKSMMNQWLAEHDDIVVKKKEREGEEPEADDEDDEFADDEAIHDQLLQDLCDAIGQMAIVCKGAWAKPFGDLILPVVNAMLPAEKEEELRQRALCIIDDVTEHCGDAIIPIAAQLVRPMITYATPASEPGVRQASVYGLGIAAAVLGQQFAAVMPEALAALRGVICHPEARTEENVDPTENAVSSLGRIVASQPPGPEIAQVLAFWLSQLPLRHDVVEAKSAHRVLLDMLERRSPDVLLPDLSRAPQVLSVLAEVCAKPKDLLHASDVPRLLSLLRALSSQLPPTTWSSLRPEIGQSLQKFVSSAN